MGTYARQDVAEAYLVSVSVYQKGRVCYEWLVREHWKGQTLAFLSCSVIEPRVQGV